MTVLYLTRGAATWLSWLSPKSLVFHKFKSTRVKKV